MKYQAILISLIAAVSAAPALNERAEAVSAMAAVPDWTIESFKRTCNSADTSCDISFVVDTHVAPITACAYTITGSPASRAPLNSFTCGPYTLTSGWSGIFGPGFTVWSLADWNKRLIAFPSYADSDLVNGVPVSPNRSFAVQNL
jgi:hypothetical protein